MGDPCLLSAEHLQTMSLAAGIGSFNREPIEPRLFYLRFEI